METPDNQFQRRAIAGDRHFILVDPAQPDTWALAGPVVETMDEDGICSYAAAKTISTAQLQAWAKNQNRPFRIEEKFPVVRRGISEAIAA